MRIQTLARELALKALYQHDVLGGRSEDGLRLFCSQNAKPEVAELAMGLILGCIEKQGILDDIIRRTAANWEIERMPISDRNILRLGVYELLFREQTPPKVAINEAIELAKKYSTENSPAFVNGVLDHIYATHVVSAAAPATEPTAAPASTAEAADENGPAPLASTGGPLRRADLHVHSTASDGSVEPADLPALAARAGLAAIALTDHDSVEGVAAAAEAAAAVGVQLVAGVELTGYGPALPGGAPLEVHIAGLLVDPECTALLERLRHLRAVRVERVGLMAAKLTEMGMPVDPEAVLCRAAGGAAGRVHIAQEMAARGYCSSIGEAFERYIGTGGPAYVAKERLTPQQAVALVHEAGGCAVLCHPGLLPEPERYIEELTEVGLDAVEVHSPMHTPDEERRFLDAVRRLGLVMSGGSDFHGEARPDIHIGQQAVSLVELEQLRERARRRVEIVRLSS